MNHASPKLRYFAERLIAFESKGNPSTRKAPLSSVPVIDKLRPHLATLTGNMGFHALLSRALALAARELPWMGKLQVKSDGTFDGFGEAEEKTAPEEIASGSEVLLALLLGLLVEFIGEVLTFQLVREVWPGLPLGDYFEKGDDHEKTN